MRLTGCGAEQGSHGKSVAAMPLPSISQVKAASPSEMWRRGYNAAIWRANSYRSVCETNCRLEHFGGGRLGRRDRLPPCYRTATVTPVWVGLVPTPITSGCAPDGAFDGIRTLTCMTPYTIPGADP